MPDALRDDLVRCQLRDCRELAVVLVKGVVVRGAFVRGTEGARKQKHRVYACPKHLEELENGSSIGIRGGGLVFFIEADELKVGPYSAVEGGELKERTNG